MKASANIAQDRDMSLPAVMRIIDQLIAENLVRDSGEMEPTGGRRRPLLEFNGEAHTVIGVDVSGTKMFGVVADLAGNIQHEIYRPHSDNPTSAGFEWLVDIIQHLLDASRPSGQKIQGICIGMPGITLSSLGIVKWAPTFNWRNFPLRDMLAERFDPPIFVENDVNLATLGKWGFGGLESLASGKGIAERANQQHPQSTPLSAADVFKAARAGEAWAEVVIEETIDYLSIGLANISAILDPEAVIIGGGVAEASDLLIDPIQAHLAQVIQFIPKILPAQLGKYASALGAVTLVLKATAGPYRLQSTL